MSEMNEEDKFIRTMLYEHNQMTLFLEKLGYSEEAISLIWCSDEITPEEVNDVTS
jgi:hypothetical protein